MAEHARPIALAAFAGLLVTLLGWPGVPLSPRPTNDPSWQGAMHMGLRDGLVWGRDIVYTHGPLGFLQFPAFWYSATGSLGLLYELVTRVALGAVVWHLGRRSFGWLGAALLAVASAPLIAEPLPPLVFAWALWLLTRDRDTVRPALGFAVGVALLGAIELLVKLSVGVTILALGAVTLAFVERERVRLLLAFGASAAVSLLLVWVLAGQPPGALADYLSTGSEVVSGYSQAMGLDTGPGWIRLAALALFAAGLVAVWRTTAGHPCRPRAGAAALWVVLAFFSFKSGFVRQTRAEVVLYFGALLAVLPVLAWTRSQRVAALAVMVFAFAVPLDVSERSVADIIAPRERFSNAFDQLSAIASPAQREEIKSAGRQAIVAQDLVAEPTLAALRGHTVHVAPTETAIVWAAGLRWRPLPVFQGFQAYTATLDRLNADAIAGDDAPERILLRPETGVDNRIVAFDTPETTRAMLCRYVPVTSQPGPPWIVLARGRDRCGSPRRVSSRRARWGEAVRVPAPSRRDAMVFVRVHGVDVGGLERARAALYKAHPRFVSVDGQARHRLVPGTVAGGLVLTVPRGADYPEPFQQAVAATTIAIDRDHRPGGRPLRYDFFELPIARL